MRSGTTINVLIAVVLLAFTGGCGGATELAQKPYSTPPSWGPATGSAIFGRIPSFGVNVVGGHQYKSFNSCPASGPIVYASDYNNNVINIYTTPFAGQGPCGQIAVSGPQAIFVKHPDLYVASGGAHNVQVFHRGATAPYNTYTDPTGQFVGDVTVANDGTVIASNEFKLNGGERGSISTWRSGPHGGTFVGNFPIGNDIAGAYVTVQADGTLYFSDIDSSGVGQLWTGACPLGNCGAFGLTGATTGFPGGLRSADDEDVVQIDGVAKTLITYESFPTGTSCFLGGEEPDGFDINRRENRVFYTDVHANVAVETTYRKCRLIGTVPGNPGGFFVGAAKDYPESLK